MTGHVAQGATVDRAFVLASEGMSREWAYVALSRGRLSNRLYVAAQPDDERAEFAPVAPELRDPIERLAAALRDSDGAGARDRQRRGRGERAPHGRASARRARDAGAAGARGAARRSGCPGAGGSSTSAREREEAPWRALREARRREAELRHGGAPLRERARARGRSATRARLGSRERTTERVLRDRSIGREL